MGLIIMTTINANTFNGPNQGTTEGYIPQTTIESAKIDADLTQILTDLDYHLSLLQTAFTKLDQINLEELGAIEAVDVVPVINASALKIDADNLADNVIIDTELATAIATHKNTTSVSDMHPETSIKYMEIPYSSTPTTLITTCTNLLDELKNIRYQINRLNGKTNWSDTPDASLSALYSSLNTTISSLNTHLNSSFAHLTNDEHDAIANAASPPSGNNAFATLADVMGLGAGDMLRSVYDSNSDGSVAKADAIMSGTTPKTYSDIVTKIASDISTHNANASGHHTRYTNAEAIGAINSDTDHSATAPHYYNNLLNKPPADAFTSGEVSNVRNSKLANGTTPWAGAVTLSGNYIPPQYLPIDYITSSWTDTGKIACNAYFSSSTPGTVSTTFYGPCMLLGGNGYVTDGNSYLQYSVDGGNTWNNCSNSQVMMDAPSWGDGPGLGVWIAPIGYIPSGSAFRIRAGSNFGPGSSEQIYGAGYSIRYKPL
jgi:hypothetical protein